MLLLIVGAALLASPLVAEQHDTDGEPAQEILVVEVQGTITQGTTQFLKESLAEAEAREAHAFMILLDTPGGLVDATLEIMRELLNTRIPVITYVHPSGALAASAGTFILMAGHVAVMSPGTTMGAAMPVQMQPGNGQQQPADDKTVTFLAGHMTNVAEERGRPAEIAEKFVTENLTLGATEALEEGVIEFIAADLPALLEQLDGHAVEIAGEEVILETEGATLTELEMTTRQRIMNFISNPQIALLLFLLGIYGIFFGLNMPGTYVPETLGVIALVLALFGLGMFEVNALGIVLIVAAVILFVLEAFTPTFGFLTAAGVVALIIGALLMPVEPMMPEEWFRTFIVTVLGMAAVTAGFFVLVITKVLKSRNRPAVHDELGMRGYEGVVAEELSPSGVVKIRGEWWTARSASGEPIPLGTAVRVNGQEGMQIVVEPATRPAAPEESPEASSE